MNMTTGRRGIVWKTPDITADGLKMFACITMLIQTVGIAIIEKGLIHLDQYTQESIILMQRGLMLLVKFHRRHVS